MVRAALNGGYLSYDVACEFADLIIDWLFAHPKP
jgi:hypothetical protein